MEIHKSIQSSVRCGFEIIILQPSPLCSGSIKSPAILALCNHVSLRTISSTLIDVDIRDVADGNGPW